MQQASEGSTERRQAIARWQRRRLLQRLGREGAQYEFLPRVGESVGGFLLEARLGAGSYGTVFRARRGDKLYALKLLYLPHAGRWAWRELEVLLRLHHARLVVVESHGHYYHHPEVGPLFLYIVTDFVPGLPMDKYVERHNPAALWAARAALSLAAQLKVAHSVGVVHRDIKDDNAVVGEDGKAVLVDYGVGTFPGALKVSGRRLPNTPLYRAPEAWRFRKEGPSGEDYVASARDDLWALGVLLYWLLTGTWPFYGRREEELVEAVLNSAPVPPHERNPRVPRALSDICLRMLEKAPEARYPNAQAVCEALEAALTGADAGWEVPLCEEWAPDNATTRLVGGLVAVDAETLERVMARNRRISAYEREHPRRGKPEPTEPGGPGQMPLGDEPLLEEAQALSSVDEALMEGGAALPLTTGEAVAQAVADQVPQRVRAVWGGALVLGVVALASAVFLYSTPASSPGDAPSPGAAVPVLSATPASVVAWALSGQEVAPAWCPLEGARGAAPAWAPTPAPVAFAMLPEDSTRVKTPQKQQQKRGTVRTAVANALCTAAVGAAAAGCPGAQVRDTPKPEACPAGALEAMRQLGIRTGDETGSQFPGGEPPEGFPTVREGPGAQLVLGRHLGQLEAGTVLTGKFLFGKEYVYGRFTQARRPGGDTYPVCLEAWSAWEGAVTRGLHRLPNGGQDTAKVVALYPDVVAVERFE
ncbi:serine/threonine-protein kinase [Vitiosangium sp. GDMCC 1.1324]|uniref:serine/threonine protein kinase n=1 Tax=Vitiosangium sp. (strain GDMCC 1.1324) TaxID=2138576 RepID=UPI00130D532B|nr:serine/threonine-protein kinase [Vitiosangium sp. GDMCC 1.1324]